jgi:hypothetical protein
LIFFDFNQRLIKTVGGAGRPGRFLLFVFREKVIARLSAVLRATPGIVLEARGPGHLVTATSETRRVDGIRLLAIAEAVLGKRPPDYAALVEHSLHGVNWTAELVIAGIKEVLRARPVLPSLGRRRASCSRRGAQASL